MPQFYPISHNTYFSSDKQWLYLITSFYLMLFFLDLDTEECNLGVIFIAQ